MSAFAGPSQPRKRANSGSFTSSSRPEKKYKAATAPAIRAEQKRRRKKNKKNRLQIPTIKMETDAETLSATSETMDHKGKAKESDADIITRLTEEIQAQSLLLRKHDDALRNVQQAMTCQICLDVLRRPYALAPCGHVSCHGCLFRWFSTSADKVKTCPHCRAFICKRPIEIWSIKSTVQGLLKTGLLSDVPDEPEEAVENEADPWKGLFGSRQEQQSEDEQETMGLYDPEDNVYRCLGCMHEIWDGVCSSCDRPYPNNRSQRDDFAGGFLGPPMLNFGNMFNQIPDDESLDGDEDEELEVDEELYEGSFIADDDVIDIDGFADNDDDDDDDAHDEEIRLPGALFNQPHVFTIEDSDDDEAIPTIRNRTRAVIEDDSDDEDEIRHASLARVRYRYRVNDEADDDTESVGQIDFVEELDQDNVDTPQEDDEQEHTYDDVPRYGYGVHQNDGEGYYDDSEGDLYEEDIDDGSIPGSPSHLRAQWHEDEDET